MRFALTDPRGYKLKRIMNPLLPAIALMIALPLLGVWWAGLPLARYLEFPPRTLYIAHAPFSWSAFAALAAGEALALAFALRHIASLRRRSSPTARHPTAPSPRAFPRWGWAGVALGAATWLIAWTRLPWAAPLQPHTFTPLWIAYVVVVNALTFRRAGRCMLTHEPGRLLRLAIGSAGFWWFFEYLNRFVQNWSYIEVARWDAWEYFLRATPPFATVLPAVMGTLEWLEAGPLLRRFAGAPFPPPRRPRFAGAALAVAGAAALVGIGVFPNALYPMLWLAPLGLLLGLRLLAGGKFQPLELSETQFPTIGTFTWRRFYLLPLAALACGLFWEMWNLHSLAKWVYHVPYVGGLKVFEMPLLGYFGYLPFGWECALIAAALGGKRATPSP